MQVSCPIGCGLCCEDAGNRCPHLTPTGCEWPTEKRPHGCNEYLCGVARALLEGKLDLEYARELKAWDRENEKLKTEVL